MSYLLQKIVIAAIAPLGTALLLWLAALCCLLSARMRARHMGVALGLAATAWLWMWSTPVVSDMLVRHVEADSGPRRVEEVPAADVIVVLGGAMRPAEPPNRPYPGMDAAADRVWHAARLYHAGKAPWVLVSGGADTHATESEAASMRRLLLDMRVPQQAILLEAESRDTVSNANNSAALMRAKGLRRAILVTSAVHMARAAALFTLTGVQVQPAPTDYESRNGPWRSKAALPSAEALDRSGRAIKELVGRAAAR